MARSLADITRVRPIIGMEVHVQLATKAKVFSGAPNPAHDGVDGAEPNTLIDPVVLGLPGSLPVLNLGAVELALRVGAALGCRIGGEAAWDRKSYFYPDMPKAYQISQYDRPLCGEGVFELPGMDERGGPDFSKPATRIRVTRAHLEEDAGKLLHEAPGGHAIDFSIVDYNRAGAPLLEIVTEPDFPGAAEAVLFARALRDICRAVGATRGVMQKGHMRFEPNVNVELALADGSTVRTPIVEVKNLNSFRALKGAIEFEVADQPRRWAADARVHGRGAKATRGWDDAAQRTTPQREKEDAHDYRYFPEPDLPAITVGEEWVSRVRAELPELPLAAAKRFCGELGIPAADAVALTEEPELLKVCNTAISVLRALIGPEGGKTLANIILQQCAKHANEAGVRIHELGIAAEHIGAIAALRVRGAISANAIDPLLLAGRNTQTPGEPSRAMAHAEWLARDAGLLIVRDDAAMDAWIDKAIAAHPQAAADVKAGKMQAIGRLVGEAMKMAGGSADAKTVREAILKRLGGPA